MILVIETVQAACSVALVSDAGLMDERHDIVGRGHAEALVPMIGDLLAGRVPEGILVDCGPGSFTGVRVGLAAARALGLAWNVKGSGFSLMALLAASAFAEPDAPRTLTVAIAGGHGELFVQEFERDPLIALGALRSLPPADAAAILAGGLVVGSGARALADALSARGLPATVDDRWPRASDALLLPPAFKALDMRPIYGRAPDAKPLAGL